MSLAEFPLVVQVPGWLVAAGLVARRARSLSPGGVTRRLAGWLAAWSGLSVLECAWRFGAFGRVPGYIGLAWTLVGLAVGWEIVRSLSGEVGVSRGTWIVRGALVCLALLFGVEAFLPNDPTVRPLSRPFWIAQIPFWLFVRIPIALDLTRELWRWANRPDTARWQKLCLRVAAPIFGVQMLLSVSIFLSVALVASPRVGAIVLALFALMPWLIAAGMGIAAASRDGITRGRPEGGDALHVTGPGS